MHKFLSCTVKKIFSQDILRVLRGYNKISLLKKMQGYRFKRKENLYEQSNQ